jgi:RNA polymerase sigma factor (sigma-70 family)
MRRGSARGVWKQLDGLFRFGTSGPLSDAELLGRFLAGRDEAAEAAFRSLVERYGPMVLGVCRRVLGDWHEAEDAFQATFLVLARKAAAIARREQLANWLYGVACRTALDARVRATRRRAREERRCAMSDPRVKPSDDDESVRDEVRAILDEELARLPERYRVAVILCELDGLSRRAAARRLSIPEGTLSSRLARAKGLLRERLVHRGLALSALALDGALVREAEARTMIVPFSLVDSTIRAATSVAAGASLAEVASTSVATLTQGVLKAMLLAKFKGIVLGLTAAAVVTTGVGVLAQSNGPRSRVDEDRLSVLERKLDRILEALSGSFTSAESRPARDPLVEAGRPKGAEPSPFEAGRPKGAEPTPKPDTATTPKTAELALVAGTPDTSTTSTVGTAATTEGSTPYTLSSRFPVRAQTHPGKGESASVKVSPMLAYSGASRALDARVHALEERLTELEGRFREMERRLSRHNPGGAETKAE